MRKRPRESPGLGNTSLPVRSQSKKEPQGGGKSKAIVKKRNFRFSRTPKILIKICYLEWVQREELSQAQRIS